MTKLDKNTLVPITVLISAIVVTASVVLTYSKLDNRLCRIEERQEKIVKILESSGTLMISKK